MSSVKGLDLFFEDTTGDVAATDFVEYYSRMAFQVRLHARSAARVAYTVCASTPAGAPRIASAPPLATLAFAADNALGSVTFHGRPEQAMDAFLAREASGALARRFVGSDGRAYTWAFVGGADSEEWTCTADGAEVAAYDTEKQDTRNPTDANRRGSGRQLWISEHFQQLAGELVTSLLIMRHIRKHGL